MPMDYTRYPADWKAIALATKEAAQWICQDCGMQCRRPGEAFDTHRRTMSVMHLDHNPANCDPLNLRAAPVILDTTRPCTRFTQPRRGGTSG